MAGRWLISRTLAIPPGMVSVCFCCGLLIVTLAGLSVTAQAQTPPEISSATESKSSAERSTQTQNAASSPPVAATAAPSAAPGTAPAAESSSREWAAYVQTQRDPQEVRQLVFGLSQKDRHADIVALLEEALLAGQGQPWMYEILALEMRVIGRPVDECERILLSMNDFLPRDVPSVMISAAYLARLGADGPAVRLYRRASELEPQRPEPYIMGLRAAEKVGDRELICWAAFGILRNDWAAGYDARHRRAEDALDSLIRRLERDGESAVAADVTAERQLARQRDLRITLTWAGASDLDLVVAEPLGGVCAPETPLTTGGGVYIRDGSGPEVELAVDEYVCPEAATGSYQIIIRHVHGNVVGSRATLVIDRYLGSDHHEHKERLVQLDAREVAFEISLQRGRRTSVVSAVTPGLRSTPEIGLASAVSSRSAGGRMPPGWQMFQAAPGGSPLVVNAVGFAPVVATIPDGVSLSARASVSADRRYVRLGINPVFQSITDVFTFSFAGQ